MKSVRDKKFATLYCALLVLVTIAQAATAQSNTRGMQTAPPRQTYDSQSPAAIDFTNTAPGNPAAAARRSGDVIDFTGSRNDSINPQLNNAALGSQRVPLQNMPFGNRSQPQVNTPQIFGNVNQGANEIANSGRNAIQKINESGKRFWQKAAKPFQNQNQFNLPANLNRKRNYAETQVLTDLNPLANRLKLPKLEKPAWLEKIDGRAKDLVGHTGGLQASTSGLINPFNGAQQNANQSLQNFAQGAARGTSQPNAAIPPARTASNGWLNNIQGTLQR